MRAPLTSRILRLALPLLLPVLAAVACADQPRIWFDNQRDETVTISIDGDRLIILEPHSGQWLPYSTAAWAWPRRIDVKTRDGRLIWTRSMDADDLTREFWTVSIRP